MMPVAMTVAAEGFMAVALGYMGLRSDLAWSRRRSQRRRREGDSTESQPDLRRPGGLAGVGAAEDHVLHLVATQTFCALFAHDPGEGVGHIALAAAVRADNRRDPAVERQFGAIGKRLEAGYFETFEAHNAGDPACG